MCAGSRETTRSFTHISHGGRTGRRNARARKIISFFICKNTRLNKTRHVHIFEQESMYYSIWTDTYIYCIKVDFMAVMHVERVCCQASFLEF